MSKNAGWFRFVLPLMLGALACGLPFQAATPSAPAAGGQATEVALSVQATLTASAMEVAPVVVTSTPAAPAATAPPSPTAAPSASLPDFETWMKSANILLYDDMVGDYSIKRYLPDALNGLGLTYVDSKDALGRFKEYLLAGAPGGQPWDLIISSKELRSGLSGEFYEYMDQALANGSAVIIEEWNGDEIFNGKLGRIFLRCGVEFQADWYQASLNNQVLYPVNPSHPIHQQPNGGIALSNPSGYWTYDLGDLLQLRPGSEAQLLWSTVPNSTDRYGVAAVCVDGRLILQSYSTHNYGYDRVILMWENYIYNALRARYDYLLAHPEG